MSPPSSQALPSMKECNYILRYFPLRWRAEGARFLLLATGAPFIYETPTWPSSQSDQPLSQLPVLVEKSADKETADFIISDSVAIEHYLAARAGLLVDSGLRDSARELQLRAQMEDLNVRLSQYIYGHEAGRDMAAEKFIRIANSFVDYHEELLARNGSNGHYFGNKTTYADISVFLLLTIMRRPHEVSLPGREELFSRERAPGINRVYRAVRDDPLAAPYVAWLQEDDPAVAARLASFE
ncbi:hypothetical protein XA68_11247 [Ophiocordyceps unilateralis]|uniref:GST N-terminal domain-containing protein n=1 Tax=Ophiocordyceps unilateralis TaxID=268505 RepID=A0A2A9PH98_OPHUN|nr:hypothetical protein XA68_11247 [Ophiocordyceps unilateralis]